MTRYTAASPGVAADTLPMVRPRLTLALGQIAVWPALATVVGLAFGAGAVALLLRAPVQVSDSLLVMLEAQASPSLWALVLAKSGAAGYFRPLHWAQVRVLLDLGGDPVVVFRTFHALLTVAAFWLFTRALRVRTAADLVAMLAATTVFMGIHTFQGTVRESFPINHYLEVLVATLAAVNLLRATPRVLVDVLAAVTTLAAIFTLESGVLVWICLVAGAAAGFRGVSRRGLWAATAVVGLYFWLRFGMLDIGVPALGERSTGWGFGALEPVDLISKFGAQAWMLYAYNVVCSVLTVLFSEPRAGVFVLMRELMDGKPEAWVVIRVLASIGATALVAASALRGLQARRAGREAQDDDRLLVVFAAVLAANAALSFSYTKDMIMSPAGALYAVAVFVSVRGLIATLRQRNVSLQTLALVAALFTMGSLWSVRGATLLWGLRHIAYEQRYEWAFVDTWLEEQSAIPGDAAGVALTERLRSRAITTRIPAPHFSQPWAERYVDKSY